jgi:AcrR family transcriptional regulator
MARTRENPAVRRASILDHALRLIGQHGFNGVRLQGLAKECGLSNAGLLHYFGSKDELLVALIDEIVQREIAAIAPRVAAVEQAQAQGDTARLATIALLRFMLLRATEQPEQARFLFVLQAEAMDPSHPAHVWFQTREEETVALFANLLSPIVDNSQAIARWLIAARNGLIQQWLTSPEAFDLPASWDGLMATLLPEPAANVTV